jgi:hypothetical protein
MSRIDKIKNLSVFNDLTASPTSWWTNSNLHFVPDEVVVRQISYNGAPTADGVFLIWCSLTNDYIGSFSVAEASGFTSVGVNVTPNTRIQCLPNSINQSLQFQIHSINAQSQPFASNNLTGRIVINLDFISYKK